MSVDDKGFADEMAAQKARSKEAEAARRCVVLCSTYVWCSR